MRHLVALAILALAATTGCHAQIPSNPTVYTCPSASTGTWTALETASTEITGTTSSFTLHRHMVRSGDINHQHR